ncbi:inosine triphosphate pyrophosphatase-like protein [Trichoderma evansii]
MSTTKAPGDAGPDSTGPAAGRPRAGSMRRPLQPLDIPIIKHLNSKRVILASASPRRKQLLQQIGFNNLEITPSTKPEDLDKKAYGPWEYVATTAHNKCIDVYTTSLETSLASIPDPALVIAADTIIVTRDGRILEKPRSEADHIRMLKILRDTRMHRVLTSVTVLAPREDARAPGYDIQSHTEETKVYFWEEGNGLPDDVIEAYVKTREGVDKAGGYGIQGIAGMLLVEKIEGSVDNVIGLPVKRTLTLAEKVIFQQERDEFDDEGSASE